MEDDYHRRFLLFSLLRRFLWPWVICIMLSMTDFGHLSTNTDNGWPKHVWPVTPWDWSCSAPLTLGILTREFQQISHWCGGVWIINNKRQTMTKYGVACVNIHQYIDTHSLSLPGSEPNIFRETSDIRHLSLAARLYDAVIVCDLAWRSLFLVYISCTNNILSPRLSWHIM